MNVFTNQLLPGSPDEKMKRVTGSSHVFILCAKLYKYMVRRISMTIYSFVIFLIQLSDNMCKNSLVNPSVFHMNRCANRMFSSKYVANHNLSKEKKIISISPGGYKGFYELGVCKYIKENYNLSDYVFSGASAGAWNSLILCFKRDMKEIHDKVINERIYKTKSIWELEKLVKHNLLSHFTRDDFELDKLFVGVTTIQNFKSSVIIYSNFTDLEDAINACCASSHIPLITGGIKNVYRNVLTFDGGFSRYPYLLNGNVVLNITPSLWTNDTQAHHFRLTDYTTLFSRDLYSFDEMIQQGYVNSQKNKETLDKIFL